MYARLMRVVKAVNRKYDDNEQGPEDDDDEIVEENVEISCLHCDHMLITSHSPAILMRCKIHAHSFDMSRIDACNSFSMCQGEEAND